MSALRKFFGSPFVNGALCGFAMMVAGVLAGWAVIWLVHWLPVPVVGQ